MEKLVKEFVDPAVGAVQGRPVVFNEGQNIVTRLVTLERIGGYRIDQEARDNLGLMPQFGGTVGGFRRSILENLGGFDESMRARKIRVTGRRPVIVVMEIVILGTRQYCSKDRK